MKEHDLSCADKVCKTDGTLTLVSFELPGKSLSGEPAAWAGVSLKLLNPFWKRLSLEWAADKQDCSLVRRPSLREPLWRTIFLPVAGTAAIKGCSRLHRSLGQPRYPILWVMQLKLNFARLKEDRMHRWSKLFIPTLREAPADAEVASHKFLIRAGYIRQLGAGIYNYLFLGQRSINKITGIVREEMDKIAQEFFLPGILPREPWDASGRWTVMGDNMFRLKDRKGTDLCLGMTHEEIMTHHRQKRTAQLQAVAANLVSDSDQVPR